MTGIAYDRPIDLGVNIDAVDALIEGDWAVPLHARGVILIISGAGCSRLARRNRQLGHRLYDEGFATLLVDLLSPEEEREDSLTGSLRLDIGFLADRIGSATRWVKSSSDAAHLPVGYLASGAASASALVAASRRPEDVEAIVSRGGRPDLAGVWLHKVVTPTLLLTGALDIPGIELNRWTLRRLNCEKRLITIPGATSLLDEPPAIEATCRHAADWFKHTMAPFHPMGMRRSIFSINFSERNARTSPS